ncbi:hypothetical protein [Mesorhizobium sp. M1322]|uniref:hypothetical protein n=1 Tax=Mesorhizobium sp. M1322 TaxID=2957081 RepID=UPI00333CBB99
MTTDTPLTRYSATNGALASGFVPPSYTTCALSRDLEAARYSADRAFGQHDAADPENRLVAADLRTVWSAPTTDARLKKRGLMRGFGANMLRHEIGVLAQPMTRRVKQPIEQSVATKESAKFS